MKWRSISAFALSLAMIVCLAAPAARGKKSSPSHPIDLNAATVKELEELPGVGPTTAKAIVEFRTKSGRFRRIEDLLAIRGISETKLEKLRRYVVIGPAPKKTQ